MKLYRVISQGERNSYDLFDEFRTDVNTLEGKQFFKSRVAVISFVERAILQNYDPPYRYLFIIDIDDKCLEDINVTNLPLDGYEAVSVEEDDLVSFNICVRFVTKEDL